jgi:hypothetical protein
MPMQAVLTGDLVASSEATPERIDRAMDVLAAAATDIASWRIGEAGVVDATHFTRHRGDGWQILVSAAPLGLRAALMMFARLAADPGLPATRIAVGLGPVDHVPGPDLSNAHGAAFALSGRALAQMKRGERVRLAGEGITPCLAAFIGLLDDRITDWTAEQAEAVAHVIAPEAPTQGAIATTLGISPQALSARLAGARWPRIRALLRAWERPGPPGGAPT